jgi:membrane-bound inhibitor of C-type lysozyme
MGRYSEVKSYENLKKRNSTKFTNPVRNWEKILAPEIKITSIGTHTWRYECQSKEPLDLRYIAKSADSAQTETIHLTFMIISS